MKCGGEDLTIDKNRMRAHLIAVVIVAVSQTFMVMYYYRHGKKHLNTIFSFYMLLFWFICYMYSYAPFTWIIYNIMRQSEQL